VREVIELAGAGAETSGAGGKAAGLARLIAAGLPVPPGFVVTHAAFARVACDGVAGAFVPMTGRPGLLSGSSGEPPERGGDDPGALAHALAVIAARAETAEIPAELAAVVEARAAALGGSLAVRSSVSIEDGAHGSGAGVMASRIGVAPRDVWPAIRAVWASACTPLVAHYARRTATTIEIGVVVQRAVDGDAATVYTRPPGRPDADEVWLEAGGSTTTASRDAADPRIALAIAAEAAIAASTGADVELVGRSVVQARPIVHPPPRARRTPPPAALLAPLAADRTRTWRWDVEHNPEPLSPAQAGLVAAVDAAGAAPYAMRTIAGYLYWAPTNAALSITTPASPAILRERFAVLEQVMAAALAAAGPRPTVAAAIDAYLAFYRIWANEVAPMLAAARGSATASASPGSPIARAIAEVARGARTTEDLVAELGDLALAWDVAAPTLREQPALVAGAIAAARAAPAAAAPPAAPTTLAALALELGERDDIWFARAQALVRRALLAAAAELGLADADDVFWLPLDAVIAPDGADPATLAARAGAARRAAARAASLDMPLVIGAPAPSSIADPSSVRGASGDTWRGVGIGRARGRARRLAGAAIVPPGTVVVARAITPALALLVHGAAALVSDTGGVLGHGAAIARELGIPFVVGCTGVWDAVADGDTLDVDGDAGVVRRF
jgi:phosphohistidine swiveling domain-containing protein